MCTTHLYPWPVYRFNMDITQNISEPCEISVASGDPMSGPASASPRSPKALGEGGRRWQRLELRLAQGASAAFHRLAALAPSTPNPDLEPKPQAWIDGGRLECVGSWLVPWRSGNCVSKPGAKAGETDQGVADVADHLILHRILCCQLPISMCQISAHRQSFLLEWFSWRCMAIKPHARSLG